MEKITITFPNGTKKEIPVRTRGIDILEYFGDTIDKSKVIALNVNGEVVSLSRPIKVSAKIEAITAESKMGAEVYRRSLCFLLAAAANKLYPSSRLLVGHSLGFGYYYTLDGDTPISTYEIYELEKEMRNLVRENHPIFTKHVFYEEACEIFEKLKLTETRKQLEYRCKPRVLVNKLDSSEFADIYFAPLVASTGVLKVFELKPYGEGFLLRFPEYGKPDTIPEFHDNPKIFEIYKQYKAWGKRVGVTSAASLNELIVKGKINDFIDITETFQSQNYAKVAEQIANRGNVKVVLIAGPSSSGKTTSAKKIALHLQALGYNPHVLSLDSYYVGRDKNPKDEFGNYDYECLEALDIPLLNQNLVDLFDGKTIDVPSYNFDTGTRFYTGEKMTMHENDILIMEGIHGLNDKLTPLIKSEFKFKIYLSALTQLNLDDHNRIPTSDNRLIRRIVRDANFRGKSAAGTISMWGNVQKGERLHIFPFQNNADAVLNTALDYELPVLKVYVEPALRAVKPSEPEYTEACRLLRFLAQFDAISSDYVPKQSIIREFIGGSTFKY
ncbi:MAG: nucleoside kinase [Treponema sp.]|nr:nucleoside kinase [Treponema sp.]